MKHSCFMNTIINEINYQISIFAKTGRKTEYGKIYLMTEKIRKGDNKMAKETKSQSQVSSAAVNTQKPKTAEKEKKKNEQQWKNEFEMNNQEEKRKEEERELQDLANADEVINVLFQAREAAERAVAHIDGVPADGEEVEDVSLKQLNVKSAQDFLSWMSLVGMKEAKKKKRKEAKKSLYDDFIQLNNRRMECLMDLVDENPQAMKILLFIMQNMDGYNALVCSYVVLQERFGISHATVWRHIKYLKDHGYIYAFKTGSANVYILSPELAWRSYGDNVKYCKFPANVILSYNEQKEKEGESKIKRKRGRVEIKAEKLKSANAEE